MTDPDAMAGSVWLRPLQTFALAVAFLTQVPVPIRMPPLPGDLGRAHLFFPLVGAAIGVLVGSAYWLLLEGGVPGLAAASCAIALGALATGGLHEDGLADTFDGLGGGRDRVAKLAIMRDSRLGSYGSIALTLSLLARAGALGALTGPAALASMAVAHAVSRSAATCAAAGVPAARPDGLGASGRPAPWIAAISVALSVTFAFLALRLPSAMISVAVAALASWTVSRVALRQVGGQTGDVLGAIQQVAETGVIIACAAAM